MKSQLKNEDRIYYKGVLDGYTKDAIEKKRKNKMKNIQKRRKLLNYHKRGL